MVSRRHRWKKKSRQDEYPGWVWMLLGLVIGFSVAMQVIESKIERVKIDDTTWYRVRIGPIADLNELNILQNRLAQAQIDILRIKISD